MTRLRVRWTAHAAAYVVMGALFLVVGARTHTASLVVLGGILLLLITWDALRLQVRPPQVTMEVLPLRVPEDGSIHVRLQGHGVRPNHQLHVPLSPGLRLGDGSNVWHPGTHGDAHHTFRLQAPVRGPHPVGPATVRNWSPTRLWARDQVVSQENTVEVVPRSEDVKQFGILSKVVKPMQGRFTVNRPGQGFDFFTLRQYHSGDTMRDVNWKASARSDEDLIVNQRQMETHSEMLILLDARVVSGVGAIGRTPLDRGCRAALGLFADAVAARDTARFFAYGDELHELPPGHSDRVTGLETLLARLGAKGAVPLSMVWEKARTDMKSRGPIIIISSLEADASAPAVVADMMGRGHPITVLSPTPTGMVWDSDKDRQRAREAILDAIRDRGVVVVDWSPDRPIMAERPTVQGVVA